MGFLGLTAPLLGIDTVMMEGLNPKEYDRILGIENSPYTTVAAMGLGYRSPLDQYVQAQKSRFDMTEIMDVRE